MFAVPMVQRITRTCPIASTSSSMIGSSMIFPIVFVQLVWSPFLDSMVSVPICCVSFVYLKPPDGVGIGILLCAMLCRSFRWFVGCGNNKDLFQKCICDIPESGEESVRSLSISDGLLMESLDGWATHSYLSVQTHSSFFCDRELYITY